MIESYAVNVPDLTRQIADTTVVTLARDPLSAASAWATVGLALAFVLILIVLLFILIELRKLSKAWTGLASVTQDRSRPLIEHANSAAQNVDYISQVLRSDVDRMNVAVRGLVDGIGDTSLDVQGRLRDLSALMDLVQSEAEEAVLDTATKVRSLRSGAAFIRSTGRRVLKTDGPEAEEAGDEAADGDHRDVKEGR